MRFAVDERAETAFSMFKVAEGKTHKEALRSLKRRISDALYDRLVADARRARHTPQGGYAQVLVP